MSLGEALLDARRARGLSLRLLARRSGVSYSTISRIERGVGDPRWWQVTALARSLGVSLSDLPDARR